MRIQWAEAIEGWPREIPHGRPRGAKAAGMRYERRLAAALPDATHGQWFRYKMGGRIAYCQPDLICRPVEGSVAVLECKYTWTREAHDKLRDLYVPVVELAWGVEAFGLVVVKKLISDMGSVTVTGDWAEAIRVARLHREAVWHWLSISSRPLSRATARRPYCPVPVDALF